MNGWRSVVVPFAVAMALLSSAALVDKEASGAEAAAPTVILLRLAAPDDVTTEAMARVNGELKAAGFDVEGVAFSGDEAKRDLENAGRELKPVAAFAIFVRPFEAGASVAEIWVCDRIRQKIIIQNAVLHDTDRGRGSEILAVRAVELLKASLADFWSPTPPRPHVDEAKPPEPSTAPAAPEHEAKARTAFGAGLGAGLGAGVAESVDGAATWSPDATVSYGWPSGLGVRATFIGLGPAATFSAANGSANVEQQTAVIEAVKAWWPRSALVPFVTAGAGAQRCHVVGAGSSPYQGHTLDSWSVLTAVGAGIAIPLVSTLSLVAQARGLAAWSPTVVEVAGVDAGRVGAPSVRVDAGLFGTVP
jgi:hypothetical protein